MKKLVIIFMLFLAFVPYAYSVNIGSAGYYCNLGDGNGIHVDLQNWETVPRTFTGSGKVFLCPAKPPGDEGCNQEWRGTEGYQEIDFSYTETVPAASYDSQGKLNPGRKDLWVEHGSLCSTGGGWQIDFFSLNGRNCPIETPCWGVGGYINPPEKTPTTIPQPPEKKCTLILDKYPAYSGDMLTLKLSSDNTEGRITVYVKRNGQDFFTDSVTSREENGKYVWEITSPIEVFLGDYAVSATKDGEVCEVSPSKFHVGCMALNPPSGFSARCENGYAVLEWDGLSWDEHAKKARIARKPASAEWNEEYRNYRIVDRPYSVPDRFIFRDYIGTNNKYDYNVQYCTDSRCICKTDYAGQKRVVCREERGPEPLKCSGDEYLTVEKSGSSAVVKAYSSWSKSTYDAGVFLRLKRNGNYLPGYITPDIQDGVLEGGKYVYTFTAPPLSDLSAGNYIAEFHITSSYREPGDLICASTSFSIEDVCRDAYLIPPTCSPGTKNLYVVADSPFDGNAKMEIYKNGGNLRKLGEEILRPNNTCIPGKTCYYISYSFDPGDYVIELFAPTDGGYERCFSQSLHFCSSSRCGASSISISPAPWGRRVGNRITFTLASTIPHDSPKISITGPEQKILALERTTGCPAEYCYSATTTFSRTGNYRASFSEGSELCTFTTFTIMPPLEDRCGEAFFLDTDCNQGEKQLTVVSTKIYSNPYIKLYSDGSLVDSKLASQVDCPSSYSGRHCYASTFSFSPGSYTARLLVDNTECASKQINICPTPLCGTSSINVIPLYPYVGEPVRVVVGSSVEATNPLLSVSGPVDFILSLSPSSGCSLDYCYETTTVFGTSGIYKLSFISGGDTCSSSKINVRSKKSTTTTTTIPSVCKDCCLSSLKGYVRESGGGEITNALVRCSSPTNDYVATSGIDGYYSIEGMECGLYACSVSAEGYNPAYSEINLDSRPRIKIFYLYRKTPDTGTIKGYVLSDGKPVKGAKVSCGDYVSFTSDSGYFQLEGVREGEYICTATHDGFSPVTIGTVLRGGSQKTLTFRLHPSKPAVKKIPYDSMFIPISYVTIYGKVLYDGKPVYDAYVRCGDVGTYTDRAGRFVINGIRAGKTLCTVEKPGLSGIAKEIVAVDGEEYLFSMSRAEECRTLLEITPSFSRFSGRNHVWNVELLDSSFASCGNVVSYALEISQQGNCDANLDDDRVEVTRGGKGYTRLSISTDSTCMVTLKARDSSGKIRDEAVFVLEAPLEALVVGPSELKEGEKFEIIANSSSADIVSIYFDGQRVSRCFSNSCSYEGTAVAGNHSYYAEFYSGNDVSASPVHILVVYPSSNRVSGRVVMNGRPVEGAVVMCGDDRAITDGDGYFTISPSSSICTVEKDGISAAVPSESLSRIVLSGETYVGNAVEARSIKKSRKPVNIDVIRFALVALILVILIILLIAYIIIKKSAKEEEELLKELEKYRKE